MTRPSVGTEKGSAGFFWSLLRLLRRSASESSDPPPPSQHPVAPAGRSSKTSLGFISTPLIWPVRKKPEAAVTQAPKYPAIHVTKAPPLPTKSMTYTSPEPRIPETLTGAKKTSFTTRRPAYSHVMRPHNQTEKVESFHVVSVSNRKNKPLTPQWDSSESNENSSEELDISAGFGSESFLYDIGLDESTFSLFEFDAPYSVDEGLATTSLNGSLLEMTSVPATTDKAPFEQVEIQSSMMLIGALGGSGVQMDQSGLSRLTGQTTEPAISPTYPGLTGTVRWDLPEVTATQCTFTDVRGHQQRCTREAPLLQPTVIAHGHIRPLEELFSWTEMQNTFTYSTPSRSASLKFSSAYIPYQTGLFTDPLTLQNSFTLRAEAHPMLYISPMAVVEVQHEYTIRPSRSLAASFASSATDSGDPALSQSETLFSTPNPTNNNWNSLSPPSFVTLTEGVIAASLVTSQSKLGSLQGLEPSHTNRPLETLDRTRQRDNNPSTADEWALSYAIHNSVSGSSELPHAASPILTDTWGSSSSSPLNSSFEMRTQTDDGLPMFSSTSDSSFDSSFMSSPVSQEGHSVTDMEGYTGNKAALSDVRVFMVAFPSPTLSRPIPLDFQRGQSVSQDDRNDNDDSEEDLTIPQLSDILVDESVFPEDFEETTAVYETQAFPGISANSYTYTGTRSESSISVTITAAAIADTDYHPISPTSTYCHERTVTPSSYFYSSMISGTADTEHSVSDTLTITPSKPLSSPIASSVSPVTSVVPVHGPQLIQNPGHDHMSGYFPVISGFHHASIFPSRQSRPSTLDVSVHSLGLDIHPVGPSTVSEDLQDSKHAQFSTTEQLFWSGNESARPSSNSNNVVIVQSITTDREMHPSRPTAYHQSFVSTNGTLPLSSLPNSVIADFHSAPTDATRGPAEFIPCPCKALFHGSCRCGLSPGNSMFSVENIDLRTLY